MQLDKSSALAMLFLLVVVGSPLAQSSPTELRVEELFHPVQGARCWTTGIAPVADGSFDLIGQFYNYKYSNEGENVLPEWVIVNTKSGEVKRFRFPGFGNGNYQVKNQLRAANGRIFFSCYGNYVHYYDPATRSIKSLGQLLPTDQPRRYQFFYRCIVGPDGAIYLATQSNNMKVAVARIDSETLKHQIWTDLGSDDRKEALTYGYYMQADPPWVYIGLGKGDWRLIGLNIETGESRVLSEPVTWISLQTRPDGIRADFNLEPDTSYDLGGNTMKYEGNMLHMKEGRRKQIWWAQDGKLYPAVEGAHAEILPGKTIGERFDLSKKESVALPEFEVGQPTSAGLIPFRWKQSGDNDWQSKLVSSEIVEPIQLESFFALADGRLLGNSKQYNGFYLYDPKVNSIESYGRHGPSRPTITQHEGIVYFAGYPNCVLYSFDPAQPWETGKNPTQIGHFGTSTGAHYSYSLKPTADGRLYNLGRCERGITGSGIGYYDLKTKQFHGHHENLNFHKPRGMAVMPTLGKVILSAELQNDATSDKPKPKEATLVIFDMELKEQKRLVVKPGLPSTGWIYEAPQPGQIIGCIEHADINALYRYDVKAEKLLAFKSLNVPANQIFQRPSDASWWVRLSDNTLGQLDTTSLAIRPVGKLQKPVGQLLWQGSDLYAYQYDTLVKVHVSTTD